MKAISNQTAVRTTLAIIRCLHHCQPINAQGTIYTSASAATEIEQLELDGTASVVYTGAACIEDVDPALLSQFSAVLLRRCTFGPVQLAALPSLKCVLRMGAGYDNIDTEACAKAGVVACNCPDAWTEEVADSALSLTLAIVRRSFELSAFVSSGGGWTRQAALPRKGMRRIRGASGGARLRRLRSEPHAPRSPTRRRDAARPRRLGPDRHRRRAACTRVRL